MNTGLIIIDHKNNIMWSAGFSSKRMPFAEAEEYIRNVTLGGFVDWRLPTEGELKSLVDPNPFRLQPQDKTCPLVPPFNARRFGYLHSGTLVSSSKDGGNFIMNIRNGHIFNGLGYKAYVCIVRNI